MAFEEFGVRWNQEGSQSRTIGPGKFFCPAAKIDEVDVVFS
jgi:hypothetical protein